MGWTTMQKPQNVKAFMDNLYSGPHHKVLKSAIVNFREYYAAVEFDGIVYAGVAMMDFWPHDYQSFGYKDMDDTQGPVIRNCPKAILDLLTETEDEYAINWRKECYRRIEQKATNLDLHKSLKDGQKVRCFGKEYVVRLVFRRKRGKQVLVPVFSLEGVHYRIPKTWKIEVING
jgi:hypothetical protein